MSVQSVKVIIDGIETALSLNADTGLYEGNIIAPGKSSYNVNADHYYPITVKATDDAGNDTIVNDSDATLGSFLRLVVLETTGPVIETVSPTDDSHIASGTPTITWKVTDDDSGVNADTIGVSIDGAEIITDGIAKSVITKGYQCSYAVADVLADGSHTFMFYSDDNDGNSAVQRTLNIVIDTTPPELSVSSPRNNLVTNQSTIVLSGETNDTNSNPVVVTYTLNGGSEVDVSVASDGTFCANIDIENGANTLVVKSTDAVGKSSSITRVVTMDTSAPVISDISISTATVSTGDVFSVSVKVTD